MPISFLMFEKFYFLFLENEIIRLTCVMQELEYYLKFLHKNG